MFRRLWVCTILSVFLSSCGLFASSPAPIPDSPPTTTPSPVSTPPPTETATPTLTPTPLPRVERILIVSFDGLRPDAIEKAKMVNVLSLMQSGSYSLNAQTIHPSLTLPSHASMLVGVCPAKHIVRWNEYVPQNGFARGTDLFDLAHSAGLRTVMVVGKEKLRQVTEPASTDYFAFVDNTDKISDPYTVEQLAIQQVIQGFTLMFVHFPEGDLKGHDYGWMSRKQLETYANDDESFGYILERLRIQGSFDSTLIIVTSDHGGHDTTHGTDSPDDMTIPWVISGPGVLPGHMITAPVYTMDTAATAAYMLHLPIPPEWDGIPVYEAFGQTNPQPRSEDPCLPIP